MTNCTPATARNRPPAGLAWIAGIACVACCAIPMLIAAGLLGGADWTSIAAGLPMFAVLIGTLAASAWWWAARPRTATTQSCSARGVCSDAAALGR